MLHYFRNHYYFSGLVAQGLIKSAIAPIRRSEYTVFDSQSTNRIIAEIDFEVNSESHLSSASLGEDHDSNQEAKKSTLIDTCLSGHGVLFAKERKVSSAIIRQSRRLRVSLNLIIASTKFM